MIFRKVVNMRNLDKMPQHSKLRGPWIHGYVWRSPGWVWLADEAGQSHMQTAHHHTVTPPSSLFMSSIVISPADGILVLGTLKPGAGDIKSACDTVQFAHGKFATWAKPCENTNPCEWLLHMPPLPPPQLQNDTTWQRPVQPKNYLALPPGHSPPKTLTAKLLTSSTVFPTQKQPHIMKQKYILK